MFETTRLWKVRLIHRMGYEAPHFFVETVSNNRDRYYEVEREAIKEAKKRTRLTDFPNSWEFKVEKVDKILTDGRWVYPKAEKKESSD